MKTLYRPDRDYVDGVLEERNLGEYDHGWAVTKLLFLLGSKRAGLLPLPSLRVQFAPSLIRVIDIAVFSEKPKEQIPNNPPILCIEVLSLKDRCSPMNRRIEDYLKFGVPVVWLVDPTEKTVWIYRPNGMEQATGDSIKLDGTSIEIPFAEIFE